ncbi:hypothetical protein KRX51_08270 [Corynebacterium sp. TAE3-ERU12]|uniref:hypothetical protein n=1 Tax=Corynebacterium sp. TAE3-ERU12 TaxID=2849491 RepID=UPI001C473FF3|nr:hypothetical protein [Corynebacterium sp. TAE3-ERU12]MBV7295902.1 hypothetical protein [Corynebacterium sp. TAE3-ERU12]
MTNQQLPPEVYRRRRIAAIALLAVLLLVIVALVKCSTSGDETDTDTEQAANTPKVTATRTDGSEVTTVPGEKDEESTVAAPYETTSTRETIDKDECEPGDIQLSIESDQPTYSADQNPQFSLTLYNPTRGDCTINLDEQTLRFEVFNMVDYSRIWSDLDCHESEGTGVETIAPEEEVVYTVRWSRLGSAPGACSSSERQPAPAGGYLVYGLVGERNTEPYTFNLR